MSALPEFEHVEIHSRLIAKHAQSWPEGPLTIIELMRALSVVIHDAVHEGRNIGINETYANAQKQARAIRLPVLNGR